MRFEVGIEFLRVLEFEAAGFGHVLLQRVRRIVDEHVRTTWLAISIEDAFQLQDVGTLWGPHAKDATELADGGRVDLASVAISPAGSRPAFSVDVRIQGTLEMEATDAEHARRLVDEHARKTWMAIILTDARLQELGAYWRPYEGIMPEPAGDEEDDLAYTAFRPTGDGEGR